VRLHLTERSTGCLELHDAGLLKFGSALIRNCSRGHAARRTGASSKSTSRQLDRRDGARGA
jgi:hypothetical protein